MLKQFRTRSEDGVDSRTRGKSGEKRRGWRRDTEKEFKEDRKRETTMNTRMHSTCSFGSFFLFLFFFLRLLVLSTLRRERESENGECENHRIECSVMRVDIVSIVRTTINSRPFGEESAQLKIHICNPPCTRNIRDVIQNQ